MGESGFEERRHTADWALRVWAPDLNGILEHAARGMYSLMTIERDVSPRAVREVEISAPDREGVLVNFLSELLFLLDQEGLVFDTFDLEASPTHVSARLEAVPALSIGKEIKAVTYHKLALVESPQGLEVTLVFDV